MDTLDLTKNGGLRFTQEILDFMQQSYTTAILALGKAFGNYVVLEGCVESAGVVSDGWILVDGEPIRFINSNIDSKVQITTNTQDVFFKSGTPYPIKQSQIAQCSPVGNFNYNQLKRLNDYSTMQQQLASHIASTWRAGDIKEVDCTLTYIQANFDSTGLGINERVGWAVCNGNNGTRNRQGRTSVGMYYPSLLVNPNDNVWDVLYNNIGSLFGKNKHQLTEAELAEHDHTIETGGDTYLDDWADGYIKARQNADNRVQNNKRTGKAGGNQPHENRQPSIVTLIIQKL